MKAQPALARCLIKQPLHAHSGQCAQCLGRAEARQILERIRSAMMGRTLIVAGSEIGPDQGYDLHLAFDGAKLAAVQGPAGTCTAAS